MAIDREGWRTAAVDELLEAILTLRDPDEAARFFRDLCTLRELHDLAQRWEVVRLLSAGHHYQEISSRTGASTATITRIAAWLHGGTGGYAAAVERWQKSAGIEAVPAGAPAGTPS